MKNNKIFEQRHTLIVKSNELIRKSRFSLSVVEQKLVLYIISKIKPDDKEMVEYDFEIKDFCEVCGIDYLNNLTQIKEIIKTLRDKSAWITLADGTETIVSWIEKAYLYHNSGKIKVRLDKDMMPYLLELKGNFTQYEFISILGFKSKFSIRLYEIFKSYAFLGKYSVSVDTLRKMLMLEPTQYKMMYDFRRYVIDKSIEEIKEYSDLFITYNPVYTGRSITGFEFKILEQGFDNFNFVEAMLDKEITRTGIFPAPKEKETDIEINQLVFDDIKK